MWLKLTLEILIWKLKGIIQNVVKVLEQDTTAIIPARAGRLVIGLAENGEGVIEMKTLLSLFFVFGVLMTLGCMDGQPTACGICENECPCVEADCICDIEICKCSNCIS